MRADAQPVDFLGRLDHAQPHVGLVQARQLAEGRRERRMLLGAQGPDRGEAVRLRAALLQFIDRRADRRLPAPCDIRIARQPARLRHMIVILHEQRIALARREHADRFRRHRPAGEPLHRGAEAVRAAEDEMLAAGLGQQPLDGAAAARHLGPGKARVFGVENGAQSLGEIIREAYVISHAWSVVNLRTARALGAQALR